MVCGNNLELAGIAGIFRIHAVAEFCRKDFSADFANLVIGTGCFCAGGVSECGIEFKVAVYAGLGGGTGCLRAFSVSESINKYLSAIGADLCGGAGCCRTGNMFVAAAGKCKNQSQNQKHKSKFFHFILLLIMSKNLRMKLYHI